MLERNYTGVLEETNKNIINDCDDIFKLQKYIEQNKDV